MRGKQIYLIIIPAVLILALLIFQYFISIYEVDIIISPQELFADNRSECTISTVPLNSFGIKIPFRKASAEIEIREGRELVDVILMDEKNGVIRIRAKDRAGIVIVLIKPDKALLPSSFEIIINPNFT